MNYDILIKNGRIADGTGNPWFWGDVGIKKDKVIKIGKIAEEYSNTIIDAKELVVSPGFIDIHTHTDIFHLINPLGDSFIKQGVTTNVIGNCGSSVFPVSEYMKPRYMETLKEYDLEMDWATLDDFFQKVEKNGVSLNVGSLIGHGTVRMAIMGMENRSPTAQELNDMKELIADSMKQGAFGLSSGLWYTPGSFANMDEMIELAKITAEYGGIYATHMRSQENQLIDAMNETIEIGKKANIPVQISHNIAAGGKKNWGKIKQTYKMMNKARNEGLDITCDVYAWIASSSGLTSYIPHWVHDGGIQQLVSRLKDPELRTIVKKDMKNETRVSIEEIGFENLMISNSPNHREYQGKNIAELALEKGVDNYDFIFDLIIEEEGGVSLIAFELSPEDVTNAIIDPLSMIGSDGSATAPSVIVRGKPHPRYYGNFVKVLGKYVREMEVLTLEDAVRKMTSMPAQKLGLFERGILRSGFCADIVVFDPQKIATKATFLDPHKFPVGVKSVIVNGEITVSDGTHLGTKAGKILRKTL
ncbi:amidohydrolase family protein [Thermoproteota archaeon]